MAPTSTCAFFPCFSESTLAFARVGRRAWWLAPLVLALFFARVANITYNYRSMQPELKGLAGSFEHTLPNARVLPIIQADEDSDALHHAFAHFWAYGVIRRHWFSPYLFELPGLNPLKITQQSYTLDGFWDLNYPETPDWKALQDDYDYVWSYNAPQFDAGLLADRHVDVFRRKASAVPPRTGSIARVTVARIIRWARSDYYRTLPANGIYRLEFTKSTNFHLRIYDRRRCHSTNP